MTREEAIKELKEYEDGLDLEYATPFDKAILYAIKALSQEPCTDAVSRQAVKEIINDIRDCISVEGYWAILERLKKLPSVTQKSGKWIKVTNGRGGHECDICHEYAPSYQSGDEYLTKYCPNCGAKMESEDKE